MEETEADGAPPSSDDSSGSSAGFRRRLHFQPLPFPPHHPPEFRAAKRIQKNARERERVAQVRLQYNVLRRALGDDFRTQKVNKVKTLGAAIEYIQSLRSEWDRLVRSQRDGNVSPNAVTARGLLECAQLSPPPLVCDESIEGAGEEVPGDVEDLRYHPILEDSPPEDPCILPPFFPPLLPEPPPPPHLHCGPPGAALPPECALQTPRGSPMMGGAGYGGYSPPDAPQFVGPEITELFPPTCGTMTDIIYEVGHNPWLSLSPPPVSMFRYPPVHYYS